MWKQWFSGISDGLAAAVRSVPSQCAVCHAWPARRVCDACAERFAQPRHRCATCALPVPASVRQCGECLRAPPPLSACVAAVDYGYPWSDALAEFKFRSDPGWAASLALLARAAPWAEPLLDAADAVMPVPLAPERLRERGFNQSALLAAALSPHRCDVRTLVRLRAAPAQSSLSRAGRLRNLDGVFAVAPDRAARVRGQGIVLVDDVMTTGATLHAAARVLLQAGAARVDAVVLARTG
ncbi:ComF family protein [Paracidovorax citrulli]|uniref:ComF family protein n=2 Tax=Paracidovorax citrulli TaxID=80869 RepID=A1TU14_PARC0|nr:ComF family protein [Paracidovorax citrulli]ABM34452.1 ComF family protein [Paracidovorax citrulli AAC00-1]ATG93915.1 ComF family protein [Paracidovorax citrulli]MVT28023.1 ComF family protein [Paracidovorax citrulli]MVT37230.1 ComF family protein [Paracidovorax citrulli]PVY63893.1 ComF family protein [Paracidovorax citrulli]